jgi:hypothetical protein
MAFNAVTNCKIWLAEFDLSSDLNAVAIDQMVDQLDATVFGSGGKFRKPGLLDLKASIAGFINLGAGLSEEFLSSKLGLADVPLTIAPTTGAEGEPAYSFPAAIATFDPVSGKVTDTSVQKFTLEAENTSVRLVRGTIGHNAARTGTGTGTIFNLGAVAAGQALYGVLHVPAISGGPTVTIKIQSAPTAGFAAPTDRITFTAVTTKTSQFAAAIAGPITDAFWRVTWTFAGGAGPSCTFIVNIGIL